MIARVFARKTNATPDDNLAFYDVPELFIPGGIDEVHVSVTFTYDMDRAYMLADAWSKVAPVKIGGPGTGMKGENFTPGLYLREGYVVTSRGCYNSCEYCSVHEREGDVRELPITEGWNVLDDNLLACSEKHIKDVFSMLLTVKTLQKQRIQFTGGFEAHRLQMWQIDWLLKLRPKQMFFAYDYEHPGRLDELRDASWKLRMAGITKGSLRCYVLIGWRHDTMEDAKRRLFQVVDAGFIPCAMLYRDKSGRYKEDWSGFQKQWVRPAIMRAKGII